MTRRTSSFSRKLSALKTYYNVYDWKQKDKGIGLYQKEQGGDFVATIYEDGNSIIFNNTPYNTVNGLLKAIKEYNETLQFPMRCYDTLYRTNTRLEYAVTYYLENLGFTEWKEHNIYALDSAYILKTATGRQVICITIQSNIDKDEEISLNVLINNNDSINVKITTLDSIPSIISGLFQAFVIPEISDVMLALEKLNNVTPKFDGTFKRINMTNFNITEMTLKEYAINRLEHTLKLLKENQYE